MANRITRRTVLGGAAALAVVSCAPVTSPGTAATKALQPFKWLFGFQIQAGASLPIVLAKELGYYKDQGLDVSWDFTQNSTGIRLIGTGQYQAGSVSDALTPLQFVNDGLPIKAVALITQKGAKVLAVKAGSPIKRPKDFEGKTVGIKTTPWTEYLAMLAYDKVDRSKIKEVQVGFSSVELAQGIVDVLPVFRGNEPYVLKNTLKTEVDLIAPDAYGYPPIGTSIIVNSNYAKSNPDQVLAFVKATLKATEFYLENKERSVQIANEYAGPTTVRAQHQFLYDVTGPEIKFGAALTKGVGWMSKEQWQPQIDLLAEQKVITVKPKVEDVIDTSFVEKALKDGKVVWP